MSNVNSGINNGQYGIDFHINIGTDYPTASSIESTMFWLDRVAEQHNWTNKYSSDPLINSNGFNWKRHNGSTLENFVPMSGDPWELKGYPLHSQDFWHHYRKILKFVGEKTLRHYDLTSGMGNSGIGLELAGENPSLGQSIHVSGARWGPNPGYDKWWRGYGKYQPGNWKTNNSGELSFVQYQDFGNTRYMDRAGQIHLNDYSQYIPAPETGGLDFRTFTMYKTGTYFLNEPSPENTVLQPVSTRPYNFITNERITGNWNYDPTSSTNLSGTFYNQNPTMVWSDIVNSGLADYQNKNWKIYRPANKCLSEITSTYRFDVANQINPTSHSFTRFAKIGIAHYMNVSYTYLSRNAFYNQADMIQLYLRSFTGLTPEDTLPVFYKEYNYNQSGFLRTDSFTMETSIPFSEISTIVSTSAWERLYTIKASYIPNYFPGTAKVMQYHPSSGDYLTAYDYVKVEPRNVLPKVYFGTLQNSGYFNNSNDIIIASSILNQITLGNYQQLFSLDNFKIISSGSNVPGFPEEGIITGGGAAGYVSGQEFISQASGTLRPILESGGNILYFLEAYDFDLSSEISSAQDPMTNLQQLLFGIRSDGISTITTNACHQTNTFSKYNSSSAKLTQVTDESLTTDGRHTSYGAVNSGESKWINGGGAAFPGLFSYRSDTAIYRY